MTEGQLVRYTPQGGEEISARVIMEMGKGVLISFFQQGDVVAQVINVNKELLTTGE